MGLPAKIKNELITKRERSLEAARPIMTESEAQIAAAISNPKISEKSNEELVEFIGKALPFIMRDVGIKAEPGRYEKTRFFQILQRYFKDLTFSEVKIAFELACIGELDEYLKDKGHYQSFSVEYVTKILTAYKKRRGALIGKANRNSESSAVALLAAPDVAKKVREDFYHLVCEVFDKFKEAGELPSFPNWSYLSRYLSKAGLIEGDVRVTQNHKNRALAAYEKSKTVSPFQKVIEAKQFVNEGKGFIAAQAEQIAERERVEACFRGLLKAKKDIRNLIVINESDEETEND